MRLGASSDDSQRVGVRRRTSECGTAVVEFALVVPVLLLIVFGILDFGRALNYQNDVTHLAATGARFAIVDRNPGGGTLQEWIKSQGDTGEMRDNSTVCIDFLGTEAAGQPVKVRVKVDFTWLPFIGSKGPLGVASTTMTGSAIMRLEKAPTAYDPANNDAGC